MSNSPTQSDVQTDQPKLPIWAHLVCGWPLLLVAIGGAIGGGLGGAAYGVNVAIFRSALPTPLKVLLNLVTGMAAVGIWIAIAVAIQAARE